MKAFRDAKLQILVASDLAARGLDIEGVTHVVNYDIPHDVDWYVHRIGRTGRAGNKGIAVTLYTAEEVKWLKNIETKLDVKMERQNLDGKTLVRREAKPVQKRKKLKPANRNVVKRLSLINARRLRQALIAVRIKNKYM